MRILPAAMAKRAGELNRERLVEALEGIADQIEDIVEIKPVAALEPQMAPKPVQAKKKTTGKK